MVKQNSTKNENIFREIKKSDGTISVPAGDLISIFLYAFACGAARALLRT